MTIGRSSKKNKAPRSPPFLDKANGFYGRLDEIGGDDVQVEGMIAEDQMGTSNGGENQTGPDNTSGWMEEEDHAIDFNQGMMDDDGTTLLKRKPSRQSRRWSRKSSRKPKSSPGKEAQKQSAESENKEMPPAAQSLEATNSGEPEMVHFFIKEHADNQILISRKNEREKEQEDARKNTEGKLNGDSTEIVKRNTLNNYCKAVDRAFRRGWETFITNLYSVTLTPISSTSSSSTSSSSVKSKLDRNRALAEFR